MDISFVEHNRHDNIRTSHDTFDLGPITACLYSASDLANLEKTKSFKFLWRNLKKEREKKGMYQNLEEGGIRMTDINLMFKAKMSDSFTNASLLVGILFFF